MLDELLEYKQYTFDINNSDHHVQRLKRSTLIKFNADKSKGTESPAFNGFNRFLTIIARHFLYDVYHEETDLKKKIKKTEDALRIWLGHKEPDAFADAEVHKLYRWLPLYVEKILLTESIGKLKNDISASSLSDKVKIELYDTIYQLSGSIPQTEKVKLASCLAKKCDQHKCIPGNSRSDRAVLNTEKFLGFLTDNNSKFISDIYRDFEESNTVNLTTYDRILGNALRAGCLKKYYLACEKNLIENVQIVVDGKQKKFKDTDWDIVFKMTACCMMVLSRKGTEKVSETKTITVTGIDFTNWIVNQKFEKNKQKSFFYKGEILFEDPNEGNENEKDNTKWIRLNRHWLKDSGFEILIDNSDENVVENFLKTHPHGSVFIDNGSGVPLTELRSDSFA